MCMRTNIELNDELIVEAKEYSRGKSKRAVVEEALITYIAVKKDEQKRLTYRERLEKIRLQTASMRLKSDVRDIIKKDRERI